jgi:hypothetical protein
VVNDYCSLLGHTHWLALTGGPGKGKTQIARAIIESCGFSFVWWVSLRSQVGVQAKQHLADQIILWNDTLEPSESIWQQYKLGYFDLTTATAQIGGVVSDKGVLVVDDLPDPVDRANAELYAFLAAIAEALILRGVRVLTTSQRGLPTDLKTNLTAPPIEVTPPDFSTKDVEDLLDVAGAPAGLKQEEVIGAILVITQGLPVLVAATVRWWQQAKWKRGPDEFDYLFSGGPIQGVQKDHRRQLAQLVSDRGRELVYRLSLMVSDTDIAVVARIAAVAPPISNPQECIDDLVGVWIDCSQSGQYTVSPLLKESGRQNLPPDTQRRVHGTVADYYMHLSPIEASRIFPISIHLWAAGQYKRFVRFLIQAMMQIETAAQARYLEWATMLYSPDKAWASDITLSERIMFRTAQILVKTLAGGASFELDKELDTLIAQAGSDDTDAVLFAFASILQFLTKFSEEVPAKLALDRAVKAVQMVQTAAHIRPHTPQDFLEYLRPHVLGNYIWFRGVGALLT